MRPWGPPLRTRYPLSAVKPFDDGICHLAPASKAPEAEPLSKGRHSRISDWQKNRDSDSLFLTPLSFGVDGYVARGN